MIKTGGRGELLRSALDVTMPFKTVSRLRLRPQRAAALLARSLARSRPSPLRLALLLSGALLAHPRLEIPVVVERRALFR